MFQWGSPALSRFNHIGIIHNPRYVDATSAREKRAGRLADVLSCTRRKDSPVLRSTKARESAGRRASRGRTGVDPELDTVRGAQSGAERSRAEQSRASQAREQCPFGVIPFLAIARILATRGMHAVTRLRARSLSLSLCLPPFLPLPSSPRRGACSLFMEEP